MKKILSIVVIIFIIVFLVSCKKELPPDDTYDPDFGLDLENVFFEDFSQGIDINKFELAHTKWGTTNNGVIAQNVNYTEDGIVILQANGDYYSGPLTGYNSTSGKRTGAALVSNEAFGPGRFEVKMKAMPRFGATSAFWTFYYNHTLSLNQEIDIELNVNNDFRTMWTTNWTTLNQKDHRSHQTDVVHNDGEWHVYKFEWRTDPARIDYYVDDIHLYTSYHNIPTYAGRLWVGHWFPDTWAGVPDFETDYMYVDWIRYTPYLNQPYTPTEGGRSNFPQFYPTEPIQMPLNNLISNPGFEGDIDAWRRQASSLATIVPNAGRDGSNAFYVPHNDIAYQFVTGMDETFEVYLSAFAKLENMDDEGIIYIEIRPLETAIIETYTIRFSKEDVNFVLGEYYQKDIVIQMPIGARRLEISLIGTKGQGIFFDDLFLNLTNKI